MTDDQKGYVEAKGQAPESGAPSGGFWKSLIDIYADPFKVFARIDAGLAWWKPFILISVVTMGITYLMLPFRRRIMEIGLQGTSEEQMQRTLEGFDKFGALISLIAVPILLIIAYLIVAGVAHLIINIMSSRSSFKKTLSLAIFCGFITLLEQVIGSIVIKTRGVESVESVADLKMSFSLAPLFPSVKGPLAALMESLSIFQIWYYVILILGIAAVFKISRKQAIIPAIPMWLISFVMLLLGGKFGGGGR